MSKTNKTPQIKKVENPASLNYGTVFVCRQNEIVCGWNFDNHNEKETYLKMANGMVLKRPNQNVASRVMLIYGVSMSDVRNKSSKRTLLN
jgi:hypothetical protein